MRKQKIKEEIEHCYQRVIVSTVGKQNRAQQALPRKAGNGMQD